MSGWLIAVPGSHILELLLKGSAFGFLLAAAVGPMWILCLRRTLAFGARSGIATGFGVAAADGAYAAVAAFGITAISGPLLEHRSVIGFAGAVVLLWFGIRTALARPPASGLHPPAVPVSLAAGFLSALGLTLANPPTILAFAAVFAAVGLGPGAPSTGSVSAVVLGVFLGSMAWWLVLVWAVSRLRGRVEGEFLGTVNRASGLTLLGLALWQLVALVPRTG